MGRKPLTRRRFMAIAGSVCTGLILGRMPEALKAKEGSEPYDWEAHSYLFLVDVTKCIGCGMCVRACKWENQVPPGFYRTWVERYLIGEGERVEVDSPKGGLEGFRHRPVDFRVTKAMFVPKLCNQCKNAPCIQVCPVGATYMTKDGVVLVDDRHCIGCGYCVQACPYGARYIHPVKHVAHKCTWCYHRITKGLKPACVVACPTGTRLLGDFKRPNDPVRKTIATERVMILQPELLTKPNCYYIGLDKEVR